MTTIESNHELLGQPVSVIFNYLSNFNNFGKLMPSQVTNWKSTEEKCSFTIQGLADIELNIQKKLQDEFIRIGATGKTPVPFALIWKFDKQSEVNTNVCLVIEAELNPMMSMMVKAPLQNFVNMLVQKLKEYSDSGLIA